MTVVTTEYSPVVPTLHAFPHRVDAKTYRIQTPQSPIVRNATYDEYALDEHETGTNAVVAVISYTGYDMEDAMLINKMSYERGFGHGSVYLNVTVDLRELKRPGEPMTHRFGNTLEPDGPPTPPADEREHVVGFVFTPLVVTHLHPHPAVPQRARDHPLAAHSDDDGAAVE